MASRAHHTAQTRPSDRHQPSMPASALARSNGSKDSVRPGDVDFGIRVFVRRAVSRWVAQRLSGHPSFPNSCPVQNSHSKFPDRAFYPGSQHFHGRPLWQIRYNCNHSLSKLSSITLHMSSPFLVEKISGGFVGPKIASMIVCPCIHGKWCPAFISSWWNLSCITGHQRSLPFSWRGILSGVDIIRHNWLCTDLSRGAEGLWTLSPMVLVLKRFMNTSWISAVGLQASWPVFQKTQLYVLVLWPDSKGSWLRLFVATLLDGKICQRYFSFYLRSLEGKGLHHMICQPNCASNYLWTLEVGLFPACPGDSITHLLILGQVRLFSTCRSGYGWEEHARNRMDWWIEERQVMKSEGRGVMRTGDHSFLSSWSSHFVRFPVAGRKLDVNRWIEREN